MEHPTNGTTCPLCGPTLDAHCTTCGLWWTRTTGEIFRGAGSARPSGSKRIDLRSEVSITYLITLLMFAGLGLSAAWGGIENVRQAPSSALAWASVAVGLSLGGLVGTSCILALAQVVLHALVPSYLFRNGTGLHVRVWRTWYGLMEGFHRTDVLVPCAELCGAELMVGQGSETQLFLVHVSGQSFGTGWSGSRKSAIRLSEEVMAWLEPNGVGG